MYIDVNEIHSNLDSHAAPIVQHVSFLGNVLILLVSNTFFSTFPCSVASQATDEQS